MPMERIVLSGVYKNPEDMEYVLSTYGGKGVYTVESLQHLQILNDTAVRLGMKITVLIRVTSGNQFGVDLSLIHIYASLQREISLRATVMPMQVIMKNSVPASIILWPIQTL